jgi:Na+-translocating ferredoxin:NAD+ oxidoreductase subunit B
MTVIKAAGEAEATKDGDVYVQLREFLDGLPGGYPADKNGLVIDCLEWMFTPEQAKVEMNMRSVPETAAAIAERCGKSESETERILESMVHDGLIFPVPFGKKNLYMTMQYMTGFGENQISHRLDEEKAEIGQRWFEESGFLKDFAGQRQMRVVPVSEAVKSTAEVATYDRIRETVRKQDTISVTICPCRQSDEKLGRRCGHAIENEMAFGVIAEYRLDNGFGRRISVDEAMKILDDAEEKAMVLAPVNAQEPIAMCLCGGCCCRWLQGLMLYERPADHVQASFQASVDPGLCTACGTCLERCQMDAIIEGEEHMTVDLARCIGCGLCLSSCPEMAVSMLPKPGTREPSPTYLGLNARVAGERGLPLGKMEWLMNRSSFPAFMRQWKVLHRLHLAEPLINQMAKRGLV